MEAAFTFFVLIAVGVVLSFITFFFWSRTKAFVKESLPAKGTIIGFDESRSDGVTYAPIVRFSVDGRSVEFTDSVYSNLPGCKVGDEIKILYHRRDFERARIASPYRLYFVSGLLGLLAVIFVSIGSIGFLIKSWSLIADFLR